LGVVLAILAGAGTFFYASSAQTAVAPVVPTKQVLVAAREIPAKTTLTLADLKIQEFNEGAVPAASLARMDEAVGKVTVIPMGAGEPVLASKFSDPKNPVFVVIPASALGADGAIKADTPSFRAMSITVPDANAVGGAILAGDIVDILFALNFDPIKYIVSPKSTQTADFSAKIILERVPILARTLATYTIRVDAVTAERLAYLQASGGQISFLLRAPKDERASGTAGTTFGGVYNAFRIPIPEKIAP
jgi:Flp pilus assembly protein CpaB